MPEKPLKATVDFTFEDDGTATATLSFVDSVGLAAVLPAGATVSAPPWSSSDPNLIVTPAADGLSAKLAPNTPPVLVSSAIVTIGTATLTRSDGTTATLAGTQTQPIDIVGGGPGGFAVQLSTP